MTDKIKKMVAEQLGISVSKIEDDSRLIEDLGADSLDMVEMLMKLEEEMGVSVSDEESLKIKTIKDIETIVNSKK